MKDWIKRTFTFDKMGEFIKVFVFTFLGVTLLEVIGALFGIPLGVLVIFGIIGYYYKYVR